MPIVVKNDGVPEIFERIEINGVTISFISPAFKIEDEIDGQRILRKLESFGRRCYKSEGKITESSAGPFLRSAIDRGHFSIIEHEKITVTVICDRGVTHEWVRHRLASYSQESTRYCNYGKLGFQYIKPSFFEFGSPDYERWKIGKIHSTLVYCEHLNAGRTPQEARGDLVNSLKTEIVVTFNMREWRHFFALRCTKAAHPQIREIGIAILREFQERIPVLFDDFIVEDDVIVRKPIKDLLSDIQILEECLGKRSDEVDRLITEIKRKVANLNLAT